MLNTRVQVMKILSFGNYTFLPVLKNSWLFRREHSWLFRRERLDGEERSLPKLKGKLFPKLHRVDKVVAKHIATCGIHFHSVLRKGRASGGALDTHFHFWDLVFHYV